MGKTKKRERVRVAVAGFRVRSGRAGAVLLAGSRRRPELLARAEVALSDPADADTVQPYHATFGTLLTDGRRLAPRLARVRRAAERSVAATLAAWRGLGVEVRTAAIVVGSLTPPESIGNEHMRAHALEGRLFRTVLADALAACGVESELVLERDVAARAAAVLSRTAVDLRASVSDLGRAVGKPWQADHKLAALAAWARLTAPRTRTRAARRAG